jgi:hypothetical protein
MTRSCETFRPTLKALADGAVEPIGDELALHLDECPACRQRFDLGKIDLPREAFEVLDETARRRMLVTLGSARLARPVGWSWPTAAAVAAASLILAVGALHLAVQRPTAKAVADALAEDHIRYLDHPDRKGGADPAALERHLGSYVDFPVELVVPPDARLTGGRRCFVLGRRVALVFYETPDGPASYFVLAANGLDAPGRGCPGADGFACSAGHGFRLVSWESAGLLHVLIGSRESSLLEMARACRSMTTG